jgi:FAD synthase
VYSIVGRYDGRDYKGLVSIGTNPTFDGRSARSKRGCSIFRRRSTAKN